MTPQDGNHKAFKKWSDGLSLSWAGNAQGGFYDQSKQHGWKDCCKISLDWSVKVCNNFAGLNGRRRRRNTECDVDGTPFMVVTTKHTNPLGKRPKASYGLDLVNKCPGNDVAWPRVMCRMWLSSMKLYLNSLASMASSDVQYAVSEIAGNPARPDKKCQMHADILGKKNGGLAVRVHRRKRENNERPNGSNGH